MLLLVEPIWQQLTTIPMHVHRKAAVTAEGKPKYNKIYRTRSQNWRVTAVKEPKTYNFWPTIVTRILKKRVTDDDSVLAKVEIPADHPKKISPSIALKPIHLSPTWS